MTASLRDLERVVRGYIAEGSGLPTDHVIPGDSNGPREPDAYASASLIGTRRTGSPIYEDLGDDGVLHGIRHEARFTVNWYRDGAHSNALAFVAWSESEVGIAAAGNDNISIGGGIELRDVDLLVQGRVEERAQADIVVGWIHTHIQTEDQVEWLIVDWDDARIEADRRGD